jgi:cytidine deaminase
VTWSVMIDAARAGELIQQAREAAETAYAPYSGFRVGAALLTTAGRVYTGANIENSAYSETLCAERTAAVKAVLDGDRKFEAIAVTVAGGTDISPCGACRQVLAEFSPDMSVVTEDEKGGIRVERLADLLPRAFKL